MRGPAISALVLVLTMLAVPALGQPGSKLHSLRGQIVDDLTGRPITDAELALSNAHWEPVGEPVTPDSEGRFTFHGLAPGEYVLRASRLDFGTIYWGQLPDMGWFQTIDIHPGDEDKAVVFRLVPPGVITGTVRDESGDPIMGATVALVRREWSDGRTKLQSRVQALTDDRGQYRLSKVTPGPYTVCAFVNRPAAAAAMSSVDFLSQETQSRYYSRSCYPEPIEPGRSFRVAPGEQVSVDLTIPAVPAVRIRGHIVNGVPNMVPSLVAEGSMDGVGPSFTMANAAQGNFEFRGVLPGRYRIEQYVNQTSNGEKLGLAGRLPIVVGTANLDDVELVLEKTAEVELVFHSAENEKWDADEVSVGLQSATPTAFGVGTEVDEKIHSVRLHALPPGDYWLVTRSRDTMCVQSARLGEQELLHGRLKFMPGMTARIDVTVSKHCGSIKVRVISGGKPVPNAKVALLLSGSAQDPGDLITNFTDDRGEHSFKALPFGRYQLWAWSVDEAHSYWGPESLTDVEKQGTGVAVNGENPVEVELTLLKPEGETR